MTRQDYTWRVQQTNQVLLDEAPEEVDSLRTQLSTTQKLNRQLQSLLEVDQESHSSNKKAKALQAQLVTAQSELETVRSSLATKEKELDQRNATYDIMKTQKSKASLRTKLEVALKDKAAMSAAIEAKDKELENFREGAL